MKPQAGRTYRVRSGAFIEVIDVRGNLVDYRIHGVVATTDFVTLTNAIVGEVER